MKYRFGRWRIEPSTRELWNGDELQPVARRVFDCLAYLIDHRERAVGRDELVAALWGRVDVADVLVSQLIARARKTIGDDAQAQAAIRTITGFGYRWVMEFDPVDEPMPSPSPALADAGLPSRPIDTRPRRGRAMGVWWIAGVAIVVVVIAVAIALRSRAPATQAHPSGAQRDAVVVLPLEVDATREAGWVRLGAMDLIAERLRGAGLSVPSSDSVLVALHASPAGGAGDTAALETTLGARLLIHGRAVQAADGWRVELVAADVDGARHKVAAVRPVVTDAARQAGDLLLAALGHAGSADGSEADALDERLQRAQAAILANEFDTARTLLDQATPDEQKDPRLRYRVAQIDFHAGRLSQADTTLAELLADPSTLSPALHADMLVARGMIAMRRGDCAEAQTRYDEGVTTYGNVSVALDQGKALAGRGLARACLHRYEEAANDLGLARARMASAGDRLGLARVENYRGLLDAYRNRLTDALGDFQRAADTYASFGATDALRAALSGVLDVQVNLLQRADAVATSDRLWSMREHVPDAGQRLALDADRARALAGVGRDAEAARVLAGANADLTQPGEAGYARYVHAERAELAWRHGDPAVAMAAARLALADWPPNAGDERRERTQLTLQRASMASGQAIATPAQSDTADIRPIDQLARAEAAAERKDDGQAEASFRSAIASADAEGVPATIALVANTYATWLLAKERPRDAADAGARTAQWADRDFDCALLQAELYRALGRDDLQAAALREAVALAGERPIPVALQAATAH